MPEARVAWGAGLLLASMGAGGEVSPLVAAEQNAPPPVRTVVIGPQYQAGAVHRWPWGADYRDLYATPEAQLTDAVIDAAVQRQPPEF